MAGRARGKKGIEVKCDGVRAGILVGFDFPVGARGTAQHLRGDAWHSRVNGVKMITSGQLRTLRHGILAEYRGRAILLQRL